MPPINATHRIIYHRPDGCAFESAIHQTGETFSGEWRCVACGDEYETRGLDSLSKASAEIIGALLKHQCTPAVT
jgi:hypothetical protein